MNEKSIELKVKSMNEFTVVLSQIPSLLKTLAYEIVFRRSSVEILKHGDRKAFGPFSFFSKDTFRDLVISWENGVVQIGSSKVLPFLYWKDPDPLLIAEASLYSSDAFFSYGNGGVNAINTYIQENEKDNRVILNEDQNEWIFNLAACSEVSIVLTRGDTSNKNIQIKLGTNDNQNFEIRKTVEGEIVNKSFYPGLLKCTKFETFLLSWRNGIIKLEQTAKSRVIVSWDSGITRKYRALLLSLKSPITIASYWQYSLYNVELISFYAYNKPFTWTWITVNERKSFVFSVKACTGVLLYLSEEDRNFLTNSFRLEIGVQGRVGAKFTNVENNTWSISSKPIDLLFCADYRTFWIEWENSKHFRLGRGGVIGSDVVLRAENFGINIHSLGFANKKERINYKIANSFGNTVSFVPIKDDSIEFVRMNLTNSVLKFGIQSCDNANIRLYSQYGDENSTFQANLGIEENTKSVFKSTIEQKMENTPSILDCSTYRVFHIENDGNSTSVYKGDKTVFLSKVQDNNEFKTASFGVKSQKGIYSITWNGGNKLRL